ncbi:MAG TPA: haloalkane dehalogenase [Acidobacteriota bacterium]|nr:haloalkane dehalogenase [Acidobacteriota bacterium]
METLRTPDNRFQDLPGFDFSPNYLNINGLRVHYLGEGPPNGQIVLLLHGEPSWCYLYRKMIPVFTAAGLRVIAPDLIGFGRSDKLVRREDYSYQFHIEILKTFIEQLGLTDISLFCQDWGGLIGLRVVAEIPDRFARIVAANTALPTGDHPMPEAFLQWQHFSQTTPVFPIGTILNRGCVSELSQEVIAAYDAPFPDDSYKAGARVFPSLVPTRADDPEGLRNQQAWEVFKQWNKPFLTAFSDKDPITRGADVVFQKLIPGAKNQPHTTISEAGHFLQEDKGEELAEVVVKFIFPSARA